MRCSVCHRGLDICRVFLVAGASVCLLHVFLWFLSFLAVAVAAGTWYFADVIVQVLVLQMLMLMLMAAVVVVPGFYFY